MAVKRGLTVNVKGVREVARKLRITEERLVQESRRALYAEGRDLMNESVLEVPTKTGALAASRYVSPPTVTKEGDIKVVLGYGTYRVLNPRNNQPTAEYAHIVHEDLEAYHETGKAKFLEDPMNRRAGSFESRVANRIAKVLK